MDLDAIIAAIVGYSDQTALRAALRERAKAQVFQPFFNDGHAVATGEASEKERAAQAKLDAANKKAADAEKALDDWKKQNPDVAVIHDQYGKQIKDLKAEHDAKLAEVATQNDAREVSRSVKSLKASLVARGVDPVYANALVKDDAITTRIQPHNGSVRVLQKDKDIAFAEPDADKAIELLAEEMFQGVSSDFISSKVARGSGRGTATGDTGSTGRGKTDELYETIQEDVAKKFGRAKDDGGETGARRKSNAKDRLNERLGIRTR